MRLTLGAGRGFVVLVLVLSLLLASCRTVQAPDGRIVVVPALSDLYFPSVEGGYLLGSYSWLGEGLGSFGPFEAAIILALAWESGISLVDLLTGDVLYEYDGSTKGPILGVAAWSESPAGLDSAAYLYGYGLGGVTSLRYDGMGGALTPVERGSSAVYDMFPAGGDLTSAILTKVQPSVGLRFVLRQIAQDSPLNAPAGAAADAQAPGVGWVVSDEVLPAGNFTGELVSAFLADDDLEEPAPVLVLTRGVISRLYLDDRDGDAPVEAMQLGLDARKLRCVDTLSDAGWLCAVSVFGGDHLAVLNWDGQSVPVLRGTVTVGDGPVGIDLKLLGDGDVAIVSTGFNDGTVTEVRVTNEGGPKAVEKRPVPAGCEGPGHALYFEDDDGLAIVGTCYTTGRYYVMRSAL